MDWGVLEPAKAVAEALKGFLQALNANARRVSRVAYPLYGGFLSSLLRGSPARG
jgi:hypothetical protein